MENFFLAQSLEELSQTAESCVYYTKIMERWPKSERFQDAREGALRVCDVAPQTQPAEAQTQPTSEQTQPN